MATKPKQPKSELLKVKLLDFDRRNPRFPKKIAEGPIEDLMQRFVKDERLLEIVDSIADNGFFAGEPLLVVKNGTNRFTVVEGNRRLAALKLLTKEIDPPAGRNSIASAVENAIERPSEAACLIFEDEDQILRYLGFRHITGIKSWSALQKARYTKRLYDDNYKSLGYEEGLRLLARETGSRAAYLAQNLTALALYDEAEGRNFFDLDIGSEEIEFSLLSTALSYSNIVEYLGIESRTNVTLAGLKKTALKNLFLWLFVAKSNQKSVVAESRNLKQLAAVVTSKTAVDELLLNGRLDEAFEFSKGPSTALRESLTHAERKMEAAWKWIPKVLELDSSHQVLALNIERRSKMVRSAIEEREVSLEVEKAKTTPVKKKLVPTKKIATKKAR